MVRREYKLKRNEIYFESRRQCVGRGVVDDARELTDGKRALSIAGNYGRLIPAVVCELRGDGP